MERGGDRMNELQGTNALLCNLKDAGCDETIIKNFLRLQKEGRRQEQYRLLSLYRVSLLEQLHVSQRRIDCLDYLLYAMKKEQI